MILLFVGHFLVICRPELSCYFTEENSCKPDASLHLGAVTQLPIEIRVKIAQTSKPLVRYVLHQAGPFEKSQETHLMWNHVGE